MRILFVTRDFIGIRSLLFEGATVPKGLLPNVKILQALVERGDEVDLVVACYERSEDAFDTPLPWMKKINSIKIVNRPQTTVGKVCFAARFSSFIKKMLDDKEYDFVYFHGNLGSEMTPRILSRGISVGVRAYGSFIGIWLKEKGYLWTLFHHLPELNMVKKKKSFLLSTNDGSNMTEVVRRFYPQGPPYVFYEWDNGVDRFSDSLFEIQEEKILKRPYLFYGARIDEPKQQHRGIEILRRLREAGNDIILILSGRNYDPQYYDYLNLLVEKYKLKDYVIFLGQVTQDKNVKLHKNALASLFLSQIANRGSSFLEAVSAGSLVVVPKRDQTIADIAIDGESAVLFEDEDDAAEKLMKLMKDPLMQSRLRKGATAMAHNRILTWEERINKELNLIDEIARKTKESKSVSKD